MKCRLRQLFLLFCILVSVTTACDAKPIDGAIARTVANGWAASALPMTFSIAEPTVRGGDARPFYGPDGALLAYVIDIQPRGFIVVSADDSIEPVVAYSTEGPFHGELTPNNVLADMLIQDIPHRLSHASSASTKHLAKMADRWAVLMPRGVVQARSVRVEGDSKYGPLITDEWNQANAEYPYGVPTYNRRTPCNLLTGCVATAMGMVIHYFQYPPSASGTNSITVLKEVVPAGFNYTFDYTLMPASLSSDTPVAQAEEVAKLLWACGVSTGMDYEENVSGANPFALSDAYTRFFGYTSATACIPGADWADLASAEMVDGYPVQVAILNSLDPQNIAHSIVIDGWEMKEGLHYFHLNMGWAGAGNAWYEAGPFNAAGYYFDTIYELTYGIRAPNRPRVDKPVVSVPPGEYVFPIDVAVTCTLDGTTIRYTLDGTEPNDNSPVVTNGGSIQIDSSRDLYVRAWKSGFRPSEIVRAKYLAAMIAATPTFSPDGGTYYETRLVTVTCSTPGATTRYTTNGSEPTTGSPAIANGGSISIARSTTLKAKAWKTGLTPSNTRSASYVLKVTAPNLSPAGGTITGPQTVTVTCATPGAVIRYTTNGNDPTESSQSIASGSTIQVTQNTVLKAKAWKTGWEPSTVTRADFTLRQPTIWYVDKGVEGDTHDGRGWLTAFTKIEDALSVSAAGDQVWVAAGIYNEALLLKPGIALYGGFDGTEWSKLSRDWRVNATTITPRWDGTLNQNAVVTIPAGADPSTRIDGFTVNGADPNGLEIGCGIHCDSSSPTIANCTITGCEQGGIFSSSGSPIIEMNTVSGNSTATSGGGIRCIGGSPRIAGNTISSNASAAEGAGIFCSGCPSVDIGGNTLSQNTTSGPTDRGGAISCYQVGSALISNNYVTYNAASGECGGIRCDASSATISGNVVANNSALSAGGIKFTTSVGTSASVSVVNNTIVHNASAGLVCDTPGSPSVANNIVTANATGILSTSRCAPVLQNNCLHQSQASDYSGVAKGASDISGDPSFANADGGNYDLNIGSCCIDAGYDASAPAGTDIDGNARIFGIHVDIGAEEYTPDVVLKGIAMVAIPVIPSGSDPKPVVGFQENRWYTYLTVTNSYAAYPNTATWFNPTSATPGRGFWARFSRAVAAPAGTALPQDQPVTIHLTQGWNMVGNPYLSPLTWSVSNIKISPGNGIQTALKDSTDLVLPYAWYWQQDALDPYKGAYRLLSDPSYMHMGSEFLPAWSACWIMAKQACDIILAPSQDGPPPPPPF